MVDFLARTQKNKAFFVPDLVDRLQYHYYFLFGSFLSSFYVASFEIIFDLSQKMSQPPQ